MKLNNDLFLTLLLSIYIIYMLTYFKTRYSLAHPLSNFEDSYFKHPIGISKEKESKICRFGRDGSFLLAGFLIGKYILYECKYIKKELYFSLGRLGLITVFILSLMNLNALVYLIPFFVYESRFL